MINTSDVVLSWSVYDVVLAIICVVVFLGVF